jgi:hypothetical protein
MPAETTQWNESEAPPSGAAGAGQAGDTQALPKVATEAEESVEALVETGQAFEAGIVEGLETAADHAERPATTQAGRREDGGRPSGESR